MTIDEAIAEEKELYEIMKDRYEKLNVKNCKDRAEEHKQMIEWLEELKTIRQWKSDVMEDFCRYDVNSFDELVANARAKAIDEFVKLADECSGYTANCIEHDLALTIYTIHQIAEQLKGGAV